MPSVPYKPQLAAELFSTASAGIGYKEFQFYCLNLSKFTHLVNLGNLLIHNYL